MAKNAKAAGSNGVDEKIAKQFYGDIRRLSEEMESKKGEYMRWCKGQRELINGIYDVAKDAGLPKKALKNVVKDIELRARAERLREDLEDDDQVAFDQILEALGDFADLPLGKAAVAKTERKQADKAAADSLMN